ncbi:MAG: hypothetical protein ACRD18_08090 [Terriglobia bacterium]
MTLVRTIVDPEYKPCMECATPEKPKPVLCGHGHGVEVRKKATGDLVGYLHANCKDAWVSKNDETEFTFRPV